MAKTLHEKLVAIQSELKAPKNQRNTFGNYNYRSAEDILEAVKPLLLQHGLVLTITDEVQCIGDKNYVVALARLDGCEQSITTTGWAREAISRKGMDDSQITGATSSYARKYALGGLFCLDDTKDADATNTHDKAEETPPKPRKAKASTTEPTGKKTQEKPKTSLLDKLQERLDGFANLDELNAWFDESWVKVEEACNEVEIATAEQMFQTRFKELTEKALEG